MAVVIIWQFMTSWNEFILALVTMNSAETKPLTLVPPGLQRAVYDASRTDVRHPDADYAAGDRRVLSNAAVYGQWIDCGGGAGLGKSFACCFFYQYFQVNNVALRKANLDRFAAKLQANFVRFAASICQDLLSIIGLEDPRAMQESRQMVRTQAQGVRRSIQPAPGCV